MQLSLNHFEQTFKYDGRKTNPSKEEIDLLTAVYNPVFFFLRKKNILFFNQNGRNGGKRQTFLLPGGFPLTLLTTSSMVIKSNYSILKYLSHSDY